MKIKAAIIMIALLIVAELLSQNSQATQVHVFRWSFSMPLDWLLVVVYSLGGLIGALYWGGDSRARGKKTELSLDEPSIPLSQLR
jgi:uncharacterized integral membrane protein